MLKVGLIGTGSMGGKHAEALADVRGAKLIGITGDASKTSAAELAKKHEVPLYSSIEQLVAAENPDIIDICLPTFLHKEYTLKAASLGKHVFCEKPIANTVQDAQDMVEACENAGVKLMVGHVVRFFPEYLKAKQIADSGSLGTVGTVRMLRHGAMAPGSSRWFTDPALSGGILLDLAIHDFDWIRWTFGDVERIYAKSLIGRESHGMDHAFVSLRMKSGAIAHVTSSWALPEGFRTFLELAGTKGVITVENDDLQKPIQTMVRSENGSVVQSADSPLTISPFTAQLQHFVDCIVQDVEPSVTGGEAIKALQISLAAIESVKNNRAVSL